MKKNNTTVSLKNVPLFHDLNQQEIEKVEEITISRSLSKKSIVFSEGSEKEAVYFIKQGLVKTYKTDENGHEQIVSFLKAGDMFPHTGFFNQNPYPATAETIVDTVLLAIPLQMFEHLMMNTPSIGIKMMRVMGDIIMELQQRLQVLSGKDVKQRALSFLLRLAEQHGVEKEENTIIINVPMTHQEFANSVGTTRETINRLLNQLGKDNILKVDRNRIVITDVEALKEQMEYK
ncbi:Crp/Fnr family transcriptional regulator [Lederbergia panacisoli]|uniref:Crp/Fnr family transcriptional regulator n=1 Tax=Lederbergia panacisoli TaxID=1255251 RepID=UPI00214C97DB|nr:Crp/Fnr family transcriptional regulator [Lederbergia panacisoli]MCR2822541.1 Crp/Fnr family transcriptional regulator [Lederbergia panacisoli]